MDFNFIGGSMGSVVGEKISRAIAKNLYGTNEDGAFQFEDTVYYNNKHPTSKTLT